MAHRESFFGVRLYCEATEAADDVELYDSSKEKRKINERNFKDLSKFRLLLFWLCSRNLLRTLFLNDGTPVKH